MHKRGQKASLLSSLLKLCVMFIFTKSAQTINHLLWDSEKLSLGRRLARRTSQRAADGQDSRPAVAELRARGESDGHGCHGLFSSYQTETWLCLCLCWLVLKGKQKKPKPILGVPQKTWTIVPGKHMMVVFWSGEIGSTGQAW